MKFSKLFIPFAVFAALMFVACGDDSSSTNAITPPDGDGWSESYDQPKSSAIGNSSSSSKAKSSSSGKSSSSSSSVLKQSSSSDMSSSSENICTTCEYDVLTDERDGQTYKTVLIGEQWWMAENLNYAYLQPTEKLDSSSFCYNDSLSYCDKYGRLYLWSAAVDSAGLFSTNGKDCGFDMRCILDLPVRGVCPSGWHLPTDEEFGLLTDFAGGCTPAEKNLKLRYGMVLMTILFLCCRQV